MQRSLGKCWNCPLDTPSDFLGYDPLPNPNAPHRPGRPRGFS